MVNKVTLIGHLGATPELKVTTTGRHVVTVGLATNEVWKDQQGERQERTTWHNIVFWNGTADIVSKYCKKGDKIYVEGKITNRNYEDSEGVTRLRTEIVVQQIVLLSNRRADDAPMPDESQAPPAQTAKQPTTSTSAVGDEEENLPF